MPIPSHPLPESTYYPLEQFEEGIDNSIETFAGDLPMYVQGNRLPFATALNNLKVKVKTQEATDN
jgi:hypothetical protein